MMLRGSISAGLLFVAGFSPGAVGAQTPHPPPTVQQTNAGLSIERDGEQMRISVCSAGVLHVQAGPSLAADDARSRPWLLPAQESCPGADFHVTRTAKVVTLATATGRVELSLEDTTLRFLNTAGDALLHESGSVPRTYAAATVNGEQTYQLKQRFAPERMEAFYGLGQHQSGMFNYRGSTVLLAQNNTDVAIPLLVSSRGYAVMWNTAALSTVDNRFPSELSISAIAGTAIDYYVLYGPEMDQIIHAYRDLTGHVPMLPKWAYGFFQSKDRYKSQQEVLDVAARYRREKIPLDAIVQDWFWWQREGDPVFTADFPDVPGELRTLHQEHVHAMLSVWGLFDTTSHNYQQMLTDGMMIGQARVYDATNAQARNAYWNLLAGKLFAQGWDAFWLDSAEPEEAYPHWGDAILQDKHLAIGNGAEYTNVFPLAHTGGVAEHWRQTDPAKRVFLLTRSAFLGQQRNGTTTWSGDIYSTYHDLTRQVPAGLNFALSGNPYWTTDIGGYFQPFDRPPTDPAFQDLYARWFEFGAFCPIFRTHGHRDHNELWTYDRVEPILLKYDRLRYRLMPYIYSAAWQVSHSDGTLQRPLVMDWRTDPKVWDLGDEFLFGPSMLVAPVTREGAVSRSVYLPASPAWYDFWTGERIAGGREVQANAPLDTLPLYVKAGSILTMAPEIEYADQPTDTLELRVYRGADGSTTLYNDSGDGEGYARGEHATIDMHWDDRAQRLSFGTRKGDYPDMPQTMHFHVVWVGPQHGAGEQVTGADAVVAYDGHAVEISAPAAR